MGFDLPQPITQGLAGAIKGLRLYPSSIRRVSASSHPFGILPSLHRLHLFTT